MLQTMFSKLDWLIQIKRKEIIFLALLVFCGGWIGHLCGRVSTQYEQLFVPFSQALKSALWVIGSMLGMSVFIGIASALLRPVKLLLFSHALGAMAFLAIWRDGWITFAGALLYLGGMAWYSMVLRGELDRRLIFSLRPLMYEQRKLFVVMSLLLSVSFAWGYRLTSQNQLRVPQGFKRAAEEMLLSSLETQVQNQPGLDPAAQAIYLEQARNTLDDTLTQAESAVQPYARFIPIGLILPLYLLLINLLDSLGWISYIFFWLTFGLLTRAGLIQSYSEASERKILRL